MKKVAFILLAMLAFLASCKKEDPIPNPLYGEWRLTEWIFEGRDITDSIDVIWGENNRFITESEIARLRSVGVFYSIINGNRTRAANYEFITDDYKFIGLYMKNIDTLFIADSLAEKYKIGVGVNYGLFEIVYTNEVQLTFYSLYGVNKLKFDKL